MGGCLRVTLAILVVVAAALLYIDINRESFYVFDPDVLHKVARETALMNLTIHEKVSRITHELHKIYPDHIDTHEEWIFNVAGGAMGQMTLLHCSITEYLIIFGTAIGTEGFSGIHPSDDYFTIIQGEQHSYYAGELEARIFKPGDLNLMPRGRSTGYRMPVPTYALGTLPNDDNCSFAPIPIHFYTHTYCTQGNHNYFLFSPLDLRFLGAHLLLKSSQCWTREIPIFLTE